MNRLLAPHTKPVFADLSRLNGPRFLVTVDTEEEFDWYGPFTRSDHGITHVPAISRFQELCDARGVQPAYLVDYPIANDPAAIALLGGYARDKRAAIGVQLHPWVSPPFFEDLSIINSFACNLPADLEREKLTKLHEAIVQNMGVYPQIYRAGRYGAGQATPAILRDLGLRIDSSMRSRFDYSLHGGPNYSDAPVNPFWLSPGSLLELPVTTVFGGALRTSGNMLYGRAFSSDAARSMMSRTGLLERIALTPEGIPLEKAIEGIHLALAEGIGILNFSFHSPSLVPGHTPYVRTKADLETFYAWWNGVFDYLEQRGVRPCTVEDIVGLSVPNAYADDLPLASAPLHPLSARENKGL
jgi:hypothetical protein